MTIFPQKLSRIVLTFYFILILSYICQIVIIKMYLSNVN